MPAPSAVSQDLILYEDYAQLFLARTPNQSVASSVNVLEFTPLEAEAWNHDDGTNASEPGVYSYIVDSDYLTQPDGYWTGSGGHMDPCSQQCPYPSKDRGLHTIPTQNHL